MVIAVDTAHGPSAAEVLAAEFGGEWEIWREMRPDGRHGGWIARQLHAEDGTEPLELRAPTISTLARKLHGVDR